ncbi:hypothetical protein [Lysobacter gummosus]|uniref:hypothetical protein n=1 Tax=Lysobacter gummosus TaxID=262324 RepID=UPI00362DD8A0
MYSVHVRDDGSNDEEIVVPKTIISIHPKILNNMPCAARRHALPPGRVTTHPTAGHVPSIKIQIPIVLRSADRIVGPAAFCAHPAAVNR